MLSVTGYFLHVKMVRLNFGVARFQHGCQTNITKWMTLPCLSGNMSQLYRGFFLDSMIAKLAGATIVASLLGQFERVTSHFASIKCNHRPLFLCLTTI
jgi:hypothetical protein